jgi:hypothetical protein
MLVVLVWCTCHGLEMLLSNLCTGLDTVDCSSWPWHGVYYLLAHRNLWQPNDSRAEYLMYTLVTALCHRRLLN